jgi:hypothetical protein
MTPVAGILNPILAELPAAGVLPLKNPFRGNPRPKSVLIPESRTAFLGRYFPNEALAFYR